jgi:hypothetical protein
LIWADRISARLKPKVYAPRAGLAAMRMASKASAMAVASVSMWAASEISAIELATRPATTSITMKPAMRASAPTR